MSCSSFTSKTYPFACFDVPKQYKVPPFYKKIGIFRKEIDGRESLITSSGGASDGIKFRRDFPTAFYSVKIKILLSIF